MRTFTILLLLTLTGCADNSTCAKQRGQTLYEDRMAIVTVKSSCNLSGNGCLVMERKLRDGYVRAFSLCSPPVIPSSTYAFQPETVNPYKVDHIVMDGHHVISCATSFWAGN